jgi:hypothetical protein
LNKLKQFSMICCLFLERISKASKSKIWPV